MAKIVLNDVTNINSLSVINDNFDKIEQVLQNNVLFRSNPTGETNSISQDIDFNGSKILNVSGFTSTKGEFLSRAELDAAMAEVESDRIEVKTNKTIVTNLNNNITTALLNSEALYSSFTDLYMGTATSDPTVSLDGSPLVDGQMYFNTVSVPNIMRIYNGSAWQDVGSFTTSVTTSIDPSLYPSQAEAEAGVNNTKVLTPLRGKQLIDAQTGLVRTTGTQTIGGAKTFSTAPVSSVAAVTSTELIRKGEVDTEVSTLTTAIATGVTEAKAFSRPVIARLCNQASSEDHYENVHVVTKDNQVLSYGKGGEWSPVELSRSRVAPVGSHQFSPEIPDGVTISGIIKSNGISIFCWLSNGWVYSTGFGGRGELGHGNLLPLRHMKRISYFFTNGHSIIDVKTSGYYITADYQQAYFLTSAGQVYFSGYTDGAGGAGDGFTSTRNISTPQRVGTLTGIIGLAVFGDGGLGVVGWRADGTASAWGGNMYGGLGTGVSTIVLSPATVSLSNITKVAGFAGRQWNDGTGQATTGLFLTSSGALYSSGYNASGQLGTGGTTNVNTPTQVLTAAATPITNIRDMGTAGTIFGYSWAINTANELYTWGYGGQGLGNGTTANKYYASKPSGYINRDGTLVAGDPPFQGKVSKVVTAKNNTSDFILQQMFVLDTDGKVWFVGGHNNETYSNTPGNVLSFTEITMPKLGDGDKLVDIRWQGHGVSELYYILGVTANGRLFGAGRNRWGTLTAQYYPDSWIFGFKEIKL